MVINNYHILGVAASIYYCRYFYTKSTLFHIFQNIALIGFSIVTKSSHYCHINYSIVGGGDLCKCSILALLLKLIWTHLNKRRGNVPSAKNHILERDKSRYMIRINLML